MSDVTRILSAMEQGDSSGAEQLLPLVYEELRKLAAHKLAGEKPGQTLQATALVHEAYLRLVDVENPQHWNGRGHFFAAAAEAMRRILVDRARRKKRIKHGGAYRRVELAEQDLLVESTPDDLLALDEALGKLAQEDPKAADTRQAPHLCRAVHRRGRGRTGHVPRQRLSTMDLRQGLAPLRDGRLRGKSGRLTFFENR